MPLVANGNIETKGFETNLKLRLKTFLVTLVTLTLCSEKISFNHKSINSET
jgi:hypothetical protein